VKHLYEAIQDRVATWRANRYLCADYPAIGEILDYARLPDSEDLRFLRRPQLRALETYWYLRLIEETPKIPDLYSGYFEQPVEHLGALGVKANDDRVINLLLKGGVKGFFKRVATDDAFVKELRLESLRETLTLDYPSYIFALAMGAGKTILIGTIIATEFAMALEYPDGPFVQNTLVFAPGKTILEALKELGSVPFDQILPPRLYKDFAASLKLTFTRDGEKDLPVIRGSTFNVVVTNTEKIRIQKPTLRKVQGWTQAELQERERQEQEIANLRLQAIASLPHLGIFSDEAHHTYGQSLDVELKKVRKTVDYLHEQTNLLCVVNTTGTPYFQRQPLKDVVIWYGLSEGIRDNILKDVSGSIRSYSYATSDAPRFVGEVIRDFFHDYRDVTLPSGAPARLAIYFPQTDDLEELRPVVEATLAHLGLPTTLVLEHTSKTPKENEDAFNRLAHDPEAPHRVILLVNKGTEGWNCPSLFACALARKLQSSNNFVLQASTRCLRQVAGNAHKARVYLSQENEGTLDRQLQETYGERVQDLNARTTEIRTARIKVRKIPLPPLVVRRVIRTVVRKDCAQPLSLTLRKPRSERQGVLRRRELELAVRESTSRVLRQVGETIIEAEPDTVDVYAAAVELAAVHRLDVWTVYDELKSLYSGEGEIPEDDLTDLSRQIAEQNRGYNIHEEEVEEALALVKLDGFHKEIEAGAEVYTAEISYRMDGESLLLSWEQLKVNNAGDFGFHYSPYNFDSNPEKNLFEELLRHINTHPNEVEDIYFTGALTDPKKTDFFVEYRGEDGNWHPYTPDFIIRKKDGKCLIVEVKSSQFEAAVENDLALAGSGREPLTTEGRKAVALRRWTNLNPDRLKYQLAFVHEKTVPYNALKPALDFVERPKTPDLAPEIQAAIDRIVALNDPDMIYLFGSRARGDHEPDSDLDLLVVVREPVGDRRKRQSELRHALVGSRPIVEPWIMGRLEFEETKNVVGGLAYPATHDGYVVYAKP
jgi:type III restriction enzyme